MAAILLIHGIDDNHHRMRPIQKALLRAGHTSVQAMDIRPNNGSISIEEMAGQVIIELKRLREQAGDNRKIDIVAYSMGGLAARYAIQCLGGKELVSKFITLATPHHGTYSAFLRPGLGVRQMRPGSELLQALNHDSDPWAQVEVHSFWTPFDLTIFPPSSSRLAGADSRSFPVLLHPWMTQDKRVIQVILQVLA